jgi:exopolysaccharide biosynthesis polyprenyl glycosylphosphotransferase
MNEIKLRLLANTLKLFDLGLVIVSFGLATVTVPPNSGGVPLVEFLSMKVKLWNFLIFVLMLLVWHFIFCLFGLYESKRLATRRSEAIDTVKATTVVSISLMVCATLFNIRMATSGFLFLFWIFSSAALVLGRLNVRYILGALRRRGRNLHHVLILGTNSRAIAFASIIEAKPELGYRILGFVDDDWEGTPGFLASGYVLCSTFEGLSDYLRRNVVDEVAIYLPLRSFYEHAVHVAAVCEQQGIIMRFDSDIFDLKTARYRAEELGGDPQITVSTGVLEGWPFLVKRIFDFTVSFFLLLMLLPLFLVVAIMIKLTSDGSVFFVQERIGRNKRRFRIYKFRTMIPNAEQMLAQLETINELSGPVFKIKNDPRLTPIGKYLRRTSIDELPQLLNVLKGEMSLVGPRPMAVRDFEGFNEDWQRRRFSIRPGITCLWQVNGRSSIPFPQWMELDMQYIKQWSLWLDLKILARTIPAVLKGTGAA